MENQSIMSLNQLNARITRFAETIAALERKESYLHETKPLKKVIFTIQTYLNEITEMTDLTEQQDKLARLDNAFLCFENLYTSLATAEQIVYTADIVSLEQLKSNEQLLHESLAKLKKFDGFELNAINVISAILGGLFGVVSGAVLGVVVVAIECFSSIYLGTLFSNPIMTATFFATVALMCACAGGVFGIILGYEKGTKDYAEKKTHESLDNAVLALHGLFKNKQPAPPTSVPFSTDPQKAFYRDVTEDLDSPFMPSNQI